MAARTLRPKHSDEIRAKIQASVIIGFLTEHIHGKREMTQTQVRSAEILLRKSVPDLSSVDMNVSGSVETLTPEQIDAQIEAAQARLAAPNGNR
jgi:hypothetical protein